jgi:hypothetical protein
LNELNNDAELLEQLYQLNKDKKVRNWTTNRGFTGTGLVNMVKQFGYASWSDFRIKESVHNHRVVAIEYLDDPIEVGTLTIDGDEIYPFIELHSRVNIEEYSRLFLTVQKQNLDIEQFINIFVHINNLRGWLNENFFMGEQNDINKLPEVIRQVKSMLEVVANQYELYYYED